MNKLVDISQGKWSSVHGPATKKKTTSSSVGPRSLNISVRRRENERIERENHAFAKRLFQNSGSISKQKLDLQYQTNLEIRNRIKRVKKTLPNLNNGRATQLPPLDGSAYKTSKRSFSVKQGSSVHGRTSEDVKMFSSQRGAFAGGDLNQSSATAIPINSMYDGEEERKAAIPPPLEEKAAEEEEVIEETRREDRDEVTESKE